MKAESFRAQFAPIIARVILANAGKSVVDVHRALRTAWTHQVKSVQNEYMHSEWSRETTKQLACHVDNQKTVSDLPLFNQEETS